MPLICTGISLPTEQHTLLREAARGAQRAMGGKASVSQLLSRIVTIHAEDLKALAAGESNPLEVFTGSRAEN
jgi:hypothetical protein